jgi:hypothetical protein
MLLSPRRRSPACPGLPSSAAIPGTADLVSIFPYLHQVPSGEPARHRAGDRDRVVGSVPGQKTAHPPTHLGVDTDRFVGQTKSMTDTLPPASERAASAAEWLRWSRQIRCGIRSSRRGSWFALVSLGALVLATSWLYLPSSRQGGLVSSHRTAAGVLVGPGFHSLAVTLIWIVGTPLAYLATLAYYRFRARRTGLEVSLWSWVGVGLALFAVLVLLSPATTGTALPFARWAGWLHPSDLSIRGTQPVLAVALALPLLAWLERSRALAAFAGAFLAIALWVSLYDVENLLGYFGAPLATAPGVALAGAVLVVAGLVASIHQRASHRRSPVTGAS